jgi:hypothetical protein
VDHAVWAPRRVQTEDIRTGSRTPHSQASEPSALSRKVAFPLPATDSGIDAHLGIPGAAPGQRRADGLTTHTRDLSGEGWATGPQAAGADSQPAGLYKGSSPGLPAAGPTMAQGTVIHVAPDQPTHAVCVLGTAAQLDVCR